MNRSIASTNFKLTSKCTSDDGSLKIQLISLGGILLEFHIKYAIYIVLFRSFYFQSIFKQPKHVVNGCNRCEGVYFCWKMEKFIQIACSNSIRKYIPHPHPLSSTIYGLSVENIGVSIFDEISTFASLSNLLLWRPAREIDLKKNIKIITLWTTINKSLKNGHFLLSIHINRGAVFNRPSTQPTKLDNILGTDNGVFVLCKVITDIVPFVFMVHSSPSGGVGSWLLPVCGKILQKSEILRW